jgi:hypothetical protein
LKTEVLKTLYYSTKVVPSDMPLETANLAYVLSEIGPEMSKKEIIYGDDLKYN